MKILIFIDKLSNTHSKDEEDTLIEAKQIRRTLLNKGYEVKIRKFDLNLENNIKIIKDENPSLIFNLVETLYGSSTLNIAPLLFEKNNYKYTGGNSTSLFITGDKILTKSFLKANNIKYPIYYDIYCNKVNLSLINKKVIAKEKDGEASISITDESVKTFEDQYQIIDFIKRNKTTFIEEYIEGREFNVSVIKIKNKIIVFPIAEMIFTNFSKEKPKILNYKSKWDETSFEYLNTRRTFLYKNEDLSLYKKMKSISKKCFKQLGNKGYLRVDFRVDKNNNPYVLEINVNPCINRDSGFVAAAKEYGISYNKLISIIVSEALDE